MRTSTRPASMPRPPAARRAEHRSNRPLTKGHALRWRAAAVIAVAGLSYLPWDVLLGVQLTAPLAERWRVALWTLLTVLLAGLVAAIRWPAPVAALATRLGSAAESWPDRLLPVASGLFALVCAAAVASGVFQGLPVHVDEFTQALQGRMLMQGRLWWPTPAHPEFFSSLLVVDHGGRSFSQFPPGWALLLGVAEAAGARWLAAPLCGAAAAASAVLLARALGESRAAGLLLGLLTAASPWLVLNAGSYMNHTLTLALLLGGTALLVRALQGAAARLLPLAGAGAVLGLVALVRPLEAVAFSLPAFAWLGGRAARDRREARALLVFGLGLLPPVLLTLAYNAALTGSPLRFPYEVQWGVTHGLGFHDAPWGPAHTPARGLALIHRYLLALNTNLWAAPVAALAPALLALLLQPRLSGGDRYWLGAAGLLLLGYFAYWHEGDYLGPRFLLPLAPLVILWSLRLAGAVRARLGATALADFGARAAAAWLAVMMLTGAAFVPGELEELQEVHRARRIDVDALAGAAGVRDAVVIVPSAWRSQLAARLWALGVSRPDADRLVQTIDPCVLDHAVGAAERDRLPAGGGPGLPQLLAQARPGRSGEHSGDGTPAHYTLTMSPGCRERVRAEQAGTWSLLPFLLAARHGNLYVRDLHERNAELLAEEPVRAVFVLRPDARAGLARPIFVPFSADSASASWFLYSAEALHGW